MGTAYFKAERKGVPTVSNSQSDGPQDYTRQEVLGGEPVIEFGRLPCLGNRLPVNYGVLAENNINCIAGLNNLYDILRAIPVGYNYDFKKTDEHTIWVTASAPGGSGFLARELKL